jgi:hypothetical protein
MDKVLVRGNSVQIVIIGGIRVTNIRLHVGAIPGRGVE